MSYQHDSAFFDLVNASCGRSAGGFSNDPVKSALIAADVPSVVQRSRPS